MQIQIVLTNKAKLYFGPKSQRSKRQCKASPIPSKGFGWTTAWWLEDALFISGLFAVASRLNTSAIQNKQDT